MVKKYRPDIIYHTAALPLAKIKNVNADEAKQGSVDSTINLIDAVRMQKNKKINFTRFIYISSSMIYGDFKKKLLMKLRKKTLKKHMVS